MTNKSFRTELEVAQYGIIKSMRVIRSKTGRSFKKQIWEILSNCIIRRNFSFSEYIDIIPPEGVNQKELSYFVGQRGRLQLNRRINKTLPIFTKFIIDHKILSAQIIDNDDKKISTPKLQAIFQNKGLTFCQPLIEKPEELMNFFRNVARYPLFCKPLDGSHSLGAVSVDRYDAGTDTLHLLDGNVLRVIQFVQDVVDTYSGGYLIQDRIKQHLEVEKFSGQTVSTLRIVTYRDEGVVRVAYAYWKLAAPTAMADNAWREGSTIVALDAETGVSWRAQVGHGHAARLVDVHAPSGRPLLGLTPPHWHAAREAAVHATRLFRDAPMMAWDVALGVDGPILVEGNKSPNHFLYQRASGRGVRSTALGEIEQRSMAADRIARRNHIRQEMASIRSRFANRTIGLLKRLTK